MKLFTNNFCFCCCSRKIEWTTEHDIIFFREIIAFDLYQYKPGSKERRQCLDRTAEILSSIEELCGSFRRAASLVEDTPNLKRIKIKRSNGFFTCAFFLSHRG